MDSWDVEMENNDNFSDDASEQDESESDNAQTEKKTITKEQKGNKRKKNESSPKLKKVKYEDISTGVPKRDKKKNELYKPPTVEELKTLKETEDLYNNNLFRLQIEELVKEIQVKNKRKKALDNWLNSFKKEIENIPEFNITLSDVKPFLKTKKLSKKDKFVNNLATKYTCNIKSDQDVVLKLTKPESFETFGLYENNALPGPQLHVSLQIKMPKECFYPKDFLNNRYLVKKFYYLVYLSEHISAHKKVFSYHENNVLLPVLDVQPTEDEKLGIKIYVTPLDEYFKPSRFLPNINNVKHDVFDSGIKDIEILKETPTILYNCALAFDVALTENNKFVKETLKEQKNIQEGIKLLCIWVRQRELDVGFGAFSENLILYVVIYLVLKKKVNKFMSSYQVLRNFWNFLSTTDLSKTPISLTSSSNEQLELFKKSYDVVFLDYTGCYNLAAFLNVEVLKKVRIECELALKSLDDNRVESFQALFLTKIPFCLQYDLILDLSESLPLENNFVSTDVEISKNIGYKSFLNIAHISNLLQKGLNKRIINIVPRIELQYSKKSENPIKKVMFGINLNYENAFNFIEKGPALNDNVKADEFRKFWSYLSSDRRFRDGSTNVAVYFKTSTIRAKRAIIKRIVKYLLTEKLKLNIKLYYDEFDEFLINKKITYPYPVGTNEEKSLKIVNLADDLAKKIRSLKMSLSITGIQGISEAFCYTDPFPPVATHFRPDNTGTVVKVKNVIFSDKNIDKVPRYVQPLELVLLLEHSSKWPNNLQGVRHLKTSFYLEMSKILESNHNIISNVTREYLEVFYEGLVFRFHLYVPKEIILMKKETTEGGVTKYAETEQSLKLEKVLNVLPTVIGALKGLQLQHPSFGPGTALIKRWLRSQLIDNFHLPDIVIDLLNASLYVNKTSFIESCTPQISFIRFLKFISEFQWELQPLLVNFNDEISKEDIIDLESQFQENRAAIQPLYIIMPYDQGKSVFTKESPTREILVRVQQLAEASLNMIISRIMDQRVLEIKELFKPNLEGYDLLIYLKPHLNPRTFENIESTDETLVLEKYKHHKNEKIPIVGFNPVELYLRSLRESYSEYATFFHDTYGGNTIAALWNPKSKEVKDFKVSHVNGQKLVDNKLVVNIEALIEDFYILGKGLVEWIENK